MSSYQFATQQITVYLGMINLIGGITGGILNTIVFLSLQTFRQSSCAFYLTILSIVNVLELIFGQLSRILISGYAIDWTQTSVFHCKFRIYVLQMCALVSMTCICLAVIDQYLATCSRPRWQQWSNIKIAYRLSGIMIIFWVLIYIPYLIYYDLIVTPSTSKVTCTTTNDIFLQFVNYVSAIAFAKILPIGIIFFFSILAYHNIQHLTRRTLPLVRRELDKQLTVMVLLQAFVTFFTITPGIIVFILARIPIIAQNSKTIQQIQFASTIASAIYYIYFSSPFYIYVCASNRFRRQLRFVLYGIYFDRCRQNRNTIVPLVPHIA